MFGNSFNSDNEPICPFCDKPVTQADIDAKNSCGAMSPKRDIGLFIVHVDCFQTNRLMAGMLD